MLVKRSADKHFAIFEFDGYFPGRWRRLSGKFLGTELAVETLDVEYRFKVVKVKVCGAVQGFTVPVEQIKMKRRGAFVQGKTHAIKHFAVLGAHHQFLAFSLMAQRRILLARRAFTRRKCRPFKHNDNTPSSVYVIPFPSLQDYTIIITSHKAEPVVTRRRT